MKILYHKKGVLYIIKFEFAVRNAQDNTKAGWELAPKRALV